jgi:hypothetical protein
MLRAQAEGKIWLNDVNLVRGMIFEWMILELRRLVYEIARQNDPLPISWPSVLNEAPASFTHGRVRDHARVRAFCEIFSGRDHRFAILGWNQPGGGLERYFADERYPDQDIDDPEEFHFGYPIDPAAPLDSPGLMRWLYVFHDEMSSFCLFPVAQALMEFRESFLPQDYIDDTIPGRFHCVLCETTEVLIGLPDGMLQAASSPQLNYSDLLIRARMKSFPEEGATGIENV